MVLAILVPLGFATKWYVGPGEAWFHHYAGGVIYEWFWIFLLLAVRPGWGAGRVATGVLAATTGLEFLQLWHPPWLEQLRAGWLGQALLGTTFSWWDIPHYAVGCYSGYWLVRWLLPGPAPAPALDTKNST